jgi:hypothetical protein
MFSLTAGMTNQLLEVEAKLCMKADHKTHVLNIHNVLGLNIIILEYISRKFDVTRNYAEYLFSAYLTTPFK